MDVSITFDGDQILEMCANRAKDLVRSDRLQPGKFVAHHAGTYSTKVVVDFVKEEEIKPVAPPARVRPSAVLAEPAPIRADSSGADTSGVEIEF